MRWVIRIIVVLLVAVAVAVGAAYLLPRTVEVARSTVIEASPQTIFPLVNDLQAAQRWSPWLTKGAEVDLAYQGPEAGEGQVLTWHSEDAAIGSGTQTIVESVEGELVRTSLDFGDNGTGEAQIRLDPQGEATEVTWSLDADMGNNPIGRYMGLMMDDWIGPDYEEGLALLKDLAENEAAAQATTDGSQATTDASQPTTDASQATTDASQATTEAPQAALDSPSEPTAEPQTELAQ